MGRLAFLGNFWVIFPQPANQTKSKIVSTLCLALNTYTRLITLVWLGGWTRWMKYRVHLLLNRKSIGRGRQMFVYQEADQAAGR